MTTTLVPDFLLEDLENTLRASEGRLTAERAMALVDVIRELRWFRKDDPFVSGKRMGTERVVGKLRALLAEDKLTPSALKQLLDSGFFNQ